MSAPLFLNYTSHSHFFQNFKEYTIVEKAFKGIRPGVVALIAAPTFNMTKSANINRYNCWIPIVSALLIWLLGFSPVWVILIAAFGGLYGNIKIVNQKMIVITILKHKNKLCYYTYNYSTLSLK